MFIDEVIIKVKAGDGGDGIVAWRREYMVDRGGPFGGNGGNGGSIIFRVDSGESTLLPFRYMKHLSAKNGERGGTKTQHGKSADDLIVKVPAGTVVYDLKTGAVIADLTEPGQESVIARGGKGGRGNAAFASPKNPAPEISEPGQRGEEREIKLVLKVLADVGLVGFPSVGKSTLISVVSAAKPKIAEYHFTTLHPNLGVVSVPDGRSFVMADLPGIIEGAHLGAGLGLQFLKHIERTRVILHVIDMAGSEGRNPLEDYEIINRELVNYKFNLSKRPQIVVANKMDLPGAEEYLAQFKATYPDVTVVPISAYARKNIDELLYKTADVLEHAEFMPLDEEEIIVQPPTKPEPEQKFTITLGEDNIFEVSGEIIDYYFDQTNFNQYDSVMRFSRRLRQLGVDQSLRERGVKHGDTVRIKNFEFEFFD